MSAIREQLRAHLDLYCKQRVTHESGDLNHIGYGTAGFRANAALIERLFFKVGLVSALRCLKLQANIGVMITASHNPIQDNGVKLIDSNGEMLATDWEPIVEHFCNLADNSDQLLVELDKIIEENQIDISQRTEHQISIGYDSRPSSEALVGLVKLGLDAFSGLVQYHDYGLITTPALHYLVAESNKKDDGQIISLDNYYNKLLIGGLINIFEQGRIPPCGSYAASELVVDCANGVGYETMKNLKANRQFHELLPFHLINIGDGILNHLCGADYVKTVQQAPSGANKVGKRYASLDGDADRLVYFFLDNDGDTNELRLHLLDGDKIMALFALYLGDSLRESGLEDVLSLVVVQTAYANGASTDYLVNKLKLKVEFADTGVKNLHKMATEYDVGIYFEANGHGTVWLSSRAKSEIANGSQSNGGFKKLKNLLAILNNYTGDAISDILIVETILRHYDWDVKTWYKLYEDRSNKLTKVEIKDRNCIKTTNAGRTCVEPVNLQAAIDEIVSDYGTKARCFVRASGTENVVRIYAEGQSQEDACKLADRVGIKVKEMCNI